MTSLPNAREKLLDVLGEIQNDIKELNNETLERHVETLHEQVKALFYATETHERELKETICRLNQEISDLKAKVDQLKGTLAEGEATWLWESHAARFVISSGTSLNKFGKYKQMEQRVKGKESHRQQEEANRWAQIQHVIGIKWEDLYDNFIKPMREERNRIAHPSYIDLDEIEKSLMKDASSEEQERIKGMIGMLKLTASLMKFGRLAEDYQKNKSSFPGLPFSKKERLAAEMMATWNRDFKKFQSGLQCIDHKDAIEYLKKYVADDKLARSCLHVAEALKNRNGKRLGKLARIFEVAVLDHVCVPEDIDSIHDMTTWIEEDSQEWKKWKEITQDKTWSPTHGKALEELVHLFGKSDDEALPFIDQETAACAVPDFLDKSLWKSALDILDWFEKMPSNIKRKNSYLRRSLRNRGPRSSLRKSN